MALDLTFSLSKNGESLELTDTTGTYSLSANQGGYGTPNPAASAVFLFYDKTFDDTTTTRVVIGDAFENVSADISCTADGWYRIKFSGIDNVEEAPSAASAVSNGFGYRELSSGIFYYVDEGAYVSGTINDLTATYSGTKDIWIDYNVREEETTLLQQFVDSPYTENLKLFKKKQRALHNAQKRFDENNLPQAKEDLTYADNISKANQTYKLK